MRDPAKTLLKKISWSNAMSSTFVADSTDDRKFDDTLIIIVNADGTLSVDPDALNKLISNQRTAGVSVVRVGGDRQNDGVTESSDGAGDDDPHINLTVEGFYPPGSTSAINSTATALAAATPSAVPVPSLAVPATIAESSTGACPSQPLSSLSASSIISSTTSNVPPVADGGVQSGGGDLVDPFSEMDSEQLKRLETALQSEQAKQILGENVTAMFDILNGNGEQEVPLHESIRMDHCYTNLSGPSSINNQSVGSAGTVQQTSNREQIHVQPPTQVQPQPMVAVVRGKGHRKQGVTSGGVSLSGPTLQKGGAKLVPLVHPLLLPTSTVNTVQTVGLSKPQRLILPQSKVIIAHELGAVPTLIQSPRVLLSRIPPLTTFTVSSAPAVSGGTITVGSSNLDSMKPKVVNNRAGRAGNKGGRMRGEGRKVGGGVGRNKNAKVTPEVKAQVQRLDEEMAAALRAMETSPTPPSTSSSSSVSSTTTTTTTSTKATTMSMTTASAASGAGVKVAETVNVTTALLSNPITVTSTDTLSLQNNVQTVDKKKTFFKVINKKNSDKINPHLKLTNVNAQKKTKDSKITDHLPRMTLPKKVKPAKKSADSTTPSTFPVAVTSLTLSTTQSEATPLHSSDISENSVKSPDSATPLTPVDSSLSCSTPLSAAQLSKKYPKRENRKPPAHLVDAFGPALFSTPDIIRRVSTDKPPSTPGAKENEELNTEGTKSPLDTIITTVNSQEDQLLSDNSNIVLDELSDLPIASEVMSHAEEDIVAEAETEDQAVTLDNNDVPEISSTSFKLDKETEDIVNSPIFPSSTLMFKSVSSIDDKEVDEPVTSVTSPAMGSTIINKTIHTSTTTSTTTTVFSTTTNITPVVVLTTALHTLAAKAKVTVSTPLTKPVTTSILSVTPPAAISSVTPVIAEIPTLAVRKLPPVELPATRSASKRASLQQQQQPLQEKVEQPVETQPILTQKQEPVGGAKQLPSVATSKGKRKSSMESKTSSARLSTSEEEIPSDEDGSYNSEDDPDKLWCICRKPHNNRFMICCDCCEEWFHGNCVGITKAIGKQIEEKGIEWNCPNCKKKASETKPNEITAEKVVPTNQVQKSPAEIKGNANENKQTTKDMKSPSQTKQTTLKFHFEKTASKPVGATINCIVCKKPAQAESIYCSDECIVKHGQESLEMFGNDKGDNTGKNLGDTRVIVFERKTARLLAGPNAPLASNLISWLKNHPTYEIVRPGQLPTSRFYSQPKIPTTKPALPSQANVKAQQKPPANALKQTVLTAKPGSKHVILSTKVPTMKPNRIVPIPVQPKPQLTTQKEKQPPKNEPPLDTTVMEKNHPTKEENIGTVDLTPKKTVTVSKKPSQNSTPPITTTIKTSQPSKKQRRTSNNKDDSKSSSNKKVESKRLKSNKLSEAEESSSKPEPIRLNVKKTLGELLLSRLKEVGDIQIEESEIEKLAAQIEEELFALFKDVGMKYKSKYRSLIFNIKDPKNLTLFRKIAEKSISPQQLVRLTPEELASQELAQWREREARHQLEMIKKNELDLLQLAKTVVMKTHKGEQIIEADEGLASKNPETSLTELESALNNPVDDLVQKEALIVKEKETVLSKKDEKSKDKLSDDKHRHSSRNKKDVKKIKERRSRDKKYRHKDYKRSHSHSYSRSRSRSRSRSSNRRNSESRRKSDKDKIKPKEIIKQSEESVVESQSDNVCTLEIDLDLNKDSFKKDVDSDMSDREPSSTVIIQTPPPYEEKTILWKGVLSMADVANFNTTIQEVSGDCEFLEDDLPLSIDCVGRINPDTVWDYISKIKKSGTKQIIVIRFGADNEEDKMSLLSLYSYLSSRNRMGVVGGALKMIKDFYLYPLGSHCPVPQVLLPLDGPGFEDYRPHMLIGIIIRTRRKRVLTDRDIPFIPKPVKASERSYTPPLPGAESHTPPHPPPADSSTPPQSPSLNGRKIVAPELSPNLDFEDDEPYSPGGVDDEDTPYSPGGIDDGGLGFSGSPPSSDLQRKMDELNRKIEEQKQQIQTISSAIEGTPDIDVPSQMVDIVSEAEDEAYSPSRSFTPPANDAIPFLDSSSIPADISLPSNLHEILASIKKVDEPLTSKSLDLKFDPIVQAYSKTDEPYSPDDKPGNLSVENYVPSAISPEGESSAASTASFSKDNANIKISRDPRQRNEPVKKSGLNQLTDDELIRRAAEMGFLNADEKDGESVSDVGNLAADFDQPPPPGLEEEYDVDIKNRNNNMNYPVHMGQALAFRGFPVSLPHGVGPPVIPHVPSGHPMVPPIGPPPLPLHGPPISLHGPQPPIGQMVPPPPFPPSTFVGSAPVYQQGPPPPPPPPPPPAAPPPPPPPPPTVAPFPPPSPSFKAQTPLHRSSENTGLDHSSPSTSKLKQPLHKFHQMKKGSGKRKQHSSFEEDNEHEKFGMMRKKRRESQGADGTGTWKRDIPTGNRDFMSRSSGNNYIRGHRGSGGGFSYRNRSRGFEPRGGRGNFNYRRYPQSSRGYHSNAPPGSVQSEWDEEIRHFEQNRERRHKKPEKDKHWSRGGSKNKKRSYSPDHND